MLANSAFITVGEPTGRVLEAREGAGPAGEFMLLSTDYFSRVVSMVSRGSRLGSFWSGLRFAAQAYHETRDCENIYLGEEFPGIQYLACQATLRARKRIVMLIHNVNSKRRQLPLGTLGLAKYADRLLCLSPYSKRVLIERYGIPEHKVTVVYSRVDTEFFMPDGRSEIPNQICSAGAINRDYATLIEAVRGLDVQLKIAADSAWRYSAARTKPVVDLPHNVEMHSWGTYRDLRNLYAESRLVVVPLLPRQCVSGITVALEGMAMGKVVVLSRNAYVEGFLDHAKTGFYVEPGDVEQLRNTILYLLERPEVVEEVGRNARRAVLANFTLQKYVERITSVWQGLDQWTSDRPTHPKAMHKPVLR